MSAINGLAVPPIGIPLVCKNNCCPNLIYVLFKMNSKASNQSVPLLRLVLAEPL